MKLNIITRGRRDLLQFDNADIIFKNFEGREEMYNDKGDRNFGIVIDDPEIKETLLNSKNEFGISWNVKTWLPKDGSDPVDYLPVKVSVKNGKGPKVVIDRAGRRIEIDPEDIGCLDKMSIESCDIDVRPYDDKMRGEAFRSAYLDAIWVYARSNRFDDRLANEEYPQE